MVFLLERHDLVAHHRPDGGDERTDFVGDAEIHVLLPRICRPRYDAQTAACGKRDQRDSVPSSGRMAASEVERNIRKQTQIDETKRKQNCFLLLTFIFSNRDFSMGYGQFK